jgi:hypothetical protein
VIVIYEVVLNLVRCFLVNHHQDYFIIGRDEVVLITLVQRIITPFILRLFTRKNAILKYIDYI